MDYILCRKYNLREVGDCKLVPGESAAMQHGVVVCMCGEKDKTEGKLSQKKSGALVLLGL